ncbi:MAG: WYL domain-containing protein [Verrucomicrobiales bacterium]|nr:WYL domain-containing protein [Verrucomicrobiales bacterium]MCP5558055.1 WYL domain-containing protein [Verrucomicrobiaceae bacterium]
MGNTTNPEQWAAKERLRFIERSAFWCGLVNRSDLQRVFGVSAAQASADLQMFQELCPGALVYNLKKKRYEGGESMVCKLHTPRLEEAMAFFLSEEVTASPLMREPIGLDMGARLAGVVLPVREASAAVQRAVFLAVLHGLPVEVHYASVAGKTDGWRTLRPHAFGHDGYRWHVRAWCEKNGAFRDFVLSRMKEAKVDLRSAPTPPPEPDVDWETWETVELAPNTELEPEQRAAVDRDFGMKGGKLTIQVRKAMLDYTLDHLRLPLTDGRVKPRLLGRVGSA